MSQTIYDLLGLTSSATVEEINQAYETKKQQYNPKNLAGLDADLQKLANKKFTLLSKAFELLIDPEKKKAYDAKLKQRQQSTTTPKRPQPKIAITPPPPPPLKNIEAIERPLLPASETLTTPQLIAKVEQSLSIMEEQLRSIDNTVKWQVSSVEGFDQLLEGKRGSERFFVFVNTYDSLREQDIFLLQPTIREVCSNKSFALMRRYFLFFLMTLHLEEPSLIHTAVRQFNIMAGTDKGGARNDKVMMLVSDLETRELYFPLSGDFHLPIQQIKVPPLRTSHKRLGEILVERGELTPTLQAEGLRRQAESGLRIGEIWTAMGAVSNETISEVVGYQYGLSSG